MFDQEKTESATPRRLAQAREKGQIAKSQDIIGALLVLGGFLFFSFQGESVIQTLFEVSSGLYRQKAWIQVNSDDIYTYLFQTFFIILKSFISFLVFLMIIGIGGSLVQTGWLWLPDRIIPQFSRLSPSSGIKRIFTLEGVIRTILAFGRILLCLAIAFGYLYLKWNALMQMGALSIKEIISFIFYTIINIGLLMGGVLLFFSIFDLLWQHWKLAQDLRMTPEEVKEEMKEVLGDPQIQQRRRQRQQEIGRNIKN